jgi:uncharacterized repeat protein (TIGR04052 family)
MKTTTRITAALALAAAMLLSAGRSASAHAELVSAEPAPNSQITTPPKQIKLVFSEALEAVGNSITLLDAKKTAVTIGKASLDPADDAKTTIVAEVPDGLPLGDYTVQWRNLSVDGHSEAGSFGFTLAAPAAATDMAVKFALVAGNEPVTCGEKIANLGARRTTAQITDARLYVTNVRLLTPNNKEVTLALTPDNKWQSADVALLDFEDGTGLCRDTGNADTNDTIKGKVPEGTYTGIAFDVGLPFAMNHADVAVSKTPLNIQALWWNWQSGYKFARIDLATDSPAPNDKFFIHLGSTGCGEAMADSHATASGATSQGATVTDTAKMDMSAANKPPDEPCANPNLVRVRLSKFDPSKDTVAADLAGLLRGVNIAKSTPEPAGCMSGVDDPDCTNLFPNFGLALDGGACLNDCRGQRLFRATTLPKP